jgi:hypothetical protein
LISLGSLLFSNIGDPKGSEPPKDYRCTSPKISFQAGEKLTYKLYYNWNFIWIPAGQVVFTVEESSSHFTFTAHGTTFPSYSKIFYIDDFYESKVDKIHFLPFEFKKDIKEGNYVNFNKIYFDQNLQQLKSLRGKTLDNMKEKSMNFTHCMHDVLSLLYHMRTLDYQNMAKQDKMPVEFFMDHKHYQLEVLFNGIVKQKSIKGLGSVDVLEVFPIIKGTSLFREDELTKVYATNDRNRVPVLVESPLTIGSVKAVLVETKGLKYPSSL